MFRFKRPNCKRLSLPFLIGLEKCNNLNLQKFSSRPNYKLWFSFFAVGKPIDVPKDPNPSRELVAEFHKKYENALVELFNEYKSKYHSLGNEAVIHIEWNTD